MHDEPVIEIKQLTKKFGTFTALDQLDLTVARGQVHGFLGPNGAGKSTTIRVLLGLLKKTSGEVTLLGGDPWKDAVEIHKHLAYVPGDVNLWPNLTGGEVIDLLTDIRGHVDIDRRAQLLEDFQLDPTKKCRTYSKGNRQKVALVAALASDVDLYIMDEPTSGLDPLMESVFQEYVKDLKKEGKTILLSSHILAEVEALADYVTIIREGKAVESDTLANLRHFSRMTIHASTKKPAKELDQQTGVHDFAKDGDGVVFQADRDHLGTIIAYLSKFDIVTLTSEPPKLEDLFLRHYNEDNQ